MHQTERPGAAPNTCPRPVWPPGQACPHPITAPFLETHSPSRGPALTRQDPLCKHWLAVHTGSFPRRAETTWKRPASAPLPGKLTPFSPLGAEGSASSLEVIAKGELGAGQNRVPQDPGPWPE